MSNDARQIIAQWYFKQSRDFDTVPPESTTEIYGKALLICANGDGTLAQKERDHVIGVIAASGASEAILEELKNYAATDNLEEVIATDKSIFEKGKASMIYEAILTCSADGEYSEGEKALVSKAASLIGVSEDVVKQLEEICEEEKKLFKRKIQILYSTGKPY